jgi:hypothetical protein
MLKTGYVKVMQSIPISMIILKNISLNLMKKNLVSEKNTGFTMLTFVA